MSKLFFPLLLICISFHAKAASDEVVGLMCDQNLDSGSVRNSISIRTLDEVVRLRIVDAETEETVGHIEIPNAAATPILSDNLGALDKQSFVDQKTGLRVDFKIDGREYDGKARVSALVSNHGSKLLLSNCTVMKKATVSY